MTCVVKAASSGSVSSALTRTFMAFQIAQPRPRAQVAESTGSRSLKMRQLSPTGTSKRWSCHKLDHPRLSCRNR